MGEPKILACVALIALPLWLLVRVGVRIVNALDAAQIPLKDIAFLHYRILGVPAPSATATALVAEEPPAPGDIQAPKGTAFNPWSADEEDGQW